MFTDIYRKYALLCLGVIVIHLVNSGPDMLLLLLKVLISIFASCFKKNLCNKAP